MELLSRFRRALVASRCSFARQSSPAMSRVRHTGAAAMAGAPITTGTSGLPPRGGLARLRQKNSFKRVVRGRSGGIDSALRREGVTRLVGAGSRLRLLYAIHIEEYLTMPLPSHKVGIEYDVAPSKKGRWTENGALVAGKRATLPKKKLGARARHHAAAFDSGSMVMTTEKSECRSLCDTYGDMNGGFIDQDLYKRSLPPLSLRINGWISCRSDDHLFRSRTPQAPSAELREDQRIRTLCAIHILDQILGRLANTNPIAKVRGGI